MIDGVVAHASGMWTWTDAGAIVEAGVPIVFMHGSNDPVVPYGQSVGARDFLQKASPPHPLARLRRVDRYNHWPNGVRTSECLDWLEGLTTPDAAEALTCAERMRTRKPPDIYQYTTAPAYSLALDVLHRIEGKGPRPLKDVKPELVERANGLEARIEAMGAAQVAALRSAGEKGLRSIDDLTLSADNVWLGQLLALREDFRGVESVEKYLEEIKFDKTAAKHTKAARPLVDAWYSENPPAPIYAAAVEALPRCFLCDTLPAGLGEKLTEWYNKADELKIEEKALVKGAVVNMYVDAMKRGRETYAKVLEHEGGAPSK
jgi:hypothetical protein